MSAWVTLLSRPDGYLQGVRTLWRSLQDLGTAYPFVVMVTDAVGPDVRAQLVADGCSVLEVPRLGPPTGSGDYVFAHFSEVWTKLAAWRLTDHERVVLVDSDMLAVQPMDDLFTMPLPDRGVAACHTCRCNPEHREGYPADWVPAGCAYTYAGQLPAGFVPYFNSGLVVLRPSQADYDTLVGQVAGITDLTAYPFPEQDLLNDFYRGRWAPLPWGCNALKTIAVQHPAVWDMAEVRNIHYLLAKPWDAPVPGPAVYTDLVRLWTRVHDTLAAPQVITR